MKIATIVGARPQFIKAAVVSHAFREHSPNVNEVLIHTGQHFDATMSRAFFDELDLPVADYSLGIGGGTHGQNTGRMIEAIEAVLLKEKPDWVLVYGDTDSTIAGALAAAKLQIPIAHVEAGLRSFNRCMPEEINRVLTDHLSKVLFTPTETADRNLASEGIQGASVQRVGDVMYDAMLYYSAHAAERSLIKIFNREPKSYVLATIHRAESTDNPALLTAILDGLGASRLPVVWPIHPRTRKRLAGFKLNLPRNFYLLDPVGYVDMLVLEKNAALIATDSGGVQKEAYFLGVPCITLRNETEWVETVEAGCNRLVGASEDRIRDALLNSPDLCSPRPDLFGDGHAGIAISRAFELLSNG